MNIDKAAAGKQLRVQLGCIMHNNGDRALPIGFVVQLLDALNDYDRQMLVIEQEEAAEAIEFGGKGD